MVDFFYLMLLIAYFAFFCLFIILKFILILPKKSFLNFKDYNYNRFYFISKFSIIVDIVKIVLLKIL